MQVASELNGNVIVLTGGADGIGLECAKAYAREGALVAIVDRDGEKAERAASGLGPDCMAEQADVGDGDAVQKAIAAVLTRFGRIDALHNNAGIASPSKPLDQTTEHEWDELIRINLKSIYWTTRFAADALVASRGIRGDQGRRHRAYQGHGAGLCSERNSRECNLSCRGVDTDARNVVCGTAGAGSYSQIS